MLLSLSNDRLTIFYAVAFQYLAEAFRWWQKICGKNFQGVAKKISMPQKGLDKRLLLCIGLDKWLVMGYTAPVVAPMYAGCMRAVILAIMGYLSFGFAGR